jgi:hypothetical protein
MGNNVCNLGDHQGLVIDCASLESHTALIDSARSFYSS